MDEVQLSLSFSQSARRARESNVLVARQNTTAVFQAVCKYSLQKRLLCDGFCLSPGWKVLAPQCTLGAAHVNAPRVFCCKLGHFRAKITSSQGNSWLSHPAYLQGSLLRYHRVPEYRVSKMAGAYTWSFLGPYNVQVVEKYMSGGVGSTCLSQFYGSNLLSWGTIPDFSLLFVRVKQGAVGAAWMPWHLLGADQVRVPPAFPLPPLPCGVCSKLPFQLLLQQATAIKN